MKLIFKYEEYREVRLYEIRDQRRHDACGRNHLEAGESINCEKGAMVWMSPNMQMQTSGGGVGKMFTRAISGESMFRNTYTAQGDLD